MSTKTSSTTVRECLLAARADVILGDDIESRPEVKRCLMQAAFWLERGLAAEETIASGERRRFGTVPRHD